MDHIVSDIINAKTALGIEFGSTRIKAVLIDSKNKTIAVGGHTWENKLQNGIWTYSKEDIIKGLQSCYSSLKEDVFNKYGEVLKKVGAIGISAMMHGYIALDESGEWLTPFRTWRNNITLDASQRLTKLFDFNIPQRWSIAHLYQAILNKEEHISKIKRVTTLAGYVHSLLTGENVLGVGEASGMFPIDSKSLDYDTNMVEKFDDILKENGLPYTLKEIFPRVLNAGQNAGCLTPEGAALLDTSKTLTSSIPLCPPEGDAGTGMVATNSVLKRTGNVSAGTSVFAMVVLEKSLSGVYPEIDIVTTPDGNPVAMVHANNCTSDINEWAKLFNDVLKEFGTQVDPDTLYTTLYRSALYGEKDGGGLLPFGYLSGENITSVNTGRPMLIRKENSSFTLSNLMRANMYSALGALKIGLDILFEKEKVSLDILNCHGGFFKTDEVGQKIMAAAANVKTGVNSEASEGGAWGIALLAAYLNEEESLPEFLQNKVFCDCEIKEIIPDKEDVRGFEKFMESYRAGLDAERAAAII